MENVNCTIENEQTASIKPGKNIFKIDGPIGRKAFITTIGIQILIAFAIFGIIYLIRINFGFEDIKYVFYIIGTLSSILMGYITFINYSKRIYDIIKQKDKAIFYAIAIMLASLSMRVIPPLKIIDMIISIAIILVLLFAKGELVK